MTPSQRRLFARAAGRIVAELRLAPTTAEALPQAVWDRLRRSWQHLQHAKARGWRAAERACRDQLRRSTGSLRRQLDELERVLDRAPSQRAQTLREVYEDLAAIESECAEVSVNLQEATLSVVTGPVVLAGIDLGRFEIALEWRSLHSGRACYKVYALDGGESLSESAVPHPHVRDERLCEGDGAAAIRSALRGGRLLDFYTIVAQTLATYNPQSAYRSVDELHGVACTDCGATVDSTDVGSCERCDHDLCDDCQCTCTACGRLACSDCGAACNHCGQHHCRECLVACADCGNQFCERSLNEERCEDCRAATEAANQTEREDGDPSPLPTAPNAADHSLCLGQADLSP